MTGCVDKGAYKNALALGSSSLSRGLVGLAASLALLAGGAGVVNADDAPAYRETTLGLYVTAREAFELLEQNESALLIDVRDPVEIKFTGFAEPTDIHVPWVLADTARFDKEGGTWPMVRNTDFEAQVAAALEAHRASADTPIIVMCRSGATRSAPAADAIAEMGFSEVYSVSDGFEGGTLSEGDSKGVRARDGWRNSGLPWSYEIDPDVAWYESQ
ncbi:rhodanese-like domain-containing protein [Halomonas sp. GFAJ-1]|uniref:rhodanese-like domain-containing protein n=1 Tax=Halomonas sp. GFAJ-1 TaxID=1118153 RepID=UPI00023A54D3|nr:rhodanese-like domain-containing protein [Halomonas sp. GFAJ-1]AVI61556.1 sulfurtransferase [Halomonas sp. GFAJ-1]EHK61368.1 rhodanese-like protein [Halomonas sp. GFAJ-1]